MLCIILIIGIAIRFWAANTQLTHDELSALARTHFDSFHDLIYQGVCVDGHPAGIQVLLWIQTRLFGYGEWVIRLPFFLMGCACIPLTHCFVRKWSNSNAAWWASATMAFSEYAILYTNIARPYIAGLFTILCMLCFWSNILQKVHQNRKSLQWTDIIGFGLFAALSAYTQHFAMLTAALTGMAGLFWAERDTRLKYLIGCALAIVLYIPQIFITCHQIAQYKGLEWLATPHFTFMLEYLFYLLHYSWYVLIALLIAGSFFFRLKTVKEKRKSIIFFFTLWFLPLCIGFCYSKWVSPVIQFSCLIFSWPFLLLTIGLCFRDTEKRLLSIGIISLWSLALILSMVFNPFFPHREQVFETSCVKTWELYDRYGKNEVVSWNNCDASKLKYYENKYHRSLENDMIYNSDRQTLYNILKNSSSHYLVTTEVSPYDIEIIRHYYPHLQYCKNLQRSQVLVFSKKQNNSEDEQMSFNEKNIISKDILPYNYADEFHLLTDTALFGFCKTPNTILTAEVQYRTDTEIQDYPLLVMETSCTGKNIDWHAVSLDNMPWGGEGKLILNMADIIRWPYFTKNHQIKIYLYNPRHQSGIHPQHFTLKCREGNAQEYTL